MATKLKNRLLALMLVVLLPFAYFGLCLRASVEVLKDFYEFEGMTKREWRHILKVVKTGETH
jgi:hypothetical protein